MLCIALLTKQSNYIDLTASSAFVPYLLFFFSETMKCSRPLIYIIVKMSYILRKQCETNVFELSIYRMSATCLQFAVLFISVKPPVHVHFYTSTWNFLYKMR